jgi:hypothetical protein
MNVLNLLDRVGTWLATQLYWVGQWFEPQSTPRSGLFHYPSGWRRPVCPDRE